MCKFCLFGDDRSFYFDLDSEYIKESLYRYRKKCGTAIFTGGEPNLRSDIFSLVKYAKLLKYKVSLNSNGKLYAYKDFCIELIESGVDNFTISLNAHNRKLNDELTNSKGEFDYVIAGIKNLISFRQSVSSATLINKYNYLHLTKIANILVALGVNSFNFIFFRMPNFTSSEVKKDFLFFKKDVNKILINLKKAIDLIENSGGRATVKCIPFCHMKGYEKNVVPYRKVDDIVLYPKTRLQKSLQPNLGKFVRFFKTGVCKNCIYKLLCDGIEISAPFVPKPVFQSDLYL